MIRNYFKIAWRNLIQNKTNSIINIIGLSIGVTCCIIMIIFIKYESSFDNFHTHTKQTHRIVQHNKFPEQTAYWNVTPYPLADALRNDFEELEIVTQTNGPINSLFSIENNLNEILHFEENGVLFVDSYYPKVFDFEWISGNPKTALKEANSVVLTENLVEKYFGANILNMQSVLGKTIMMNDQAPLVVTGVIKNNLGNTSQNYNMLIPYEFFKINNKYLSENWSANHQGMTYVVLRKNELKKNTESKIANWKKKYLKPDEDKRISYFLQPLSEIHNETLYGTNPGGLGYQMSNKVINTILILALFILIVAIVNFVNLITAQSATRYKEIGIRKIIGSKRSQLIMQFTFENALPIIITLIISLGLSFILINQLNGFFTNINLQLTFNWNDLKLILIIGAVTLLLASLYPAILLSSFKLIDGIKNKNSINNTKGIALRKSLSLIQFVIVQFFVVTSIIVTLQMNYFKNEESGFSSDNVIVLSNPEYDKSEILKHALLQNKNVTKVAFGSGPPMGVNGLSLGTSFRLSHQTNEEAKEAEIKVGGTNYLDFYDLNLIAGDNFNSSKEAFDQFIINETLVKSMGWTPHEAIGKKLSINEGEATIVGVVKDYHNNSLQYGITPCIIMNWTYFYNQAFIKVKNIDAETLASIEKTWNSTFPSSIYSYSLLKDSIDKEYVMERFIFKGTSILSILAIIIACLGLFSLMSFLTLRTTKEVGIRKVLGASVPQIISFFLKKFIALIVLAFIIAAPLVYYFMDRWLQNFTYRINLSLWMFIIGGIITLFIAILTSSYQSIKAAIANPIKSLRTE